MTLNEILAGAAVVLVLIAYVPYMFSIVKGKVAPHPFSWLIWAMTAAAIFMLQLSNGSGSGSFSTAAVMVCASIIFVLAFRVNKVKIRPLDVASLVAAIVGVIVWIFVNQPVVSIIILLAVEVIGFIPTLMNGWRQPYKDSMTLWSIGILRQSLSFMSIQNYNFITMLNPLVWTFICIIYVSVLGCRRLFFTKHPNRKRKFIPYN